MHGLPPRPAAPKDMAEALGRYVNHDLRKLVQAASCGQLARLAQAACKASADKPHDEMLRLAARAAEAIRDRRTCARAECLPDSYRKRIAECLIRIMATDDLEVAHG